MWRKVKGTLVIEARDREKVRRAVERAAEIIRRGGLVAFPTETVYGLGADAFNPGALAKVFRVKGRPDDNPLIVHIARQGEVHRLASRVPPAAWELARLYWPGPLTLVLPKKPEVPPAVTAGLATVAIRMPAHPVALALIKASGLPLAAPSANLSGRPSPTTAGHVLEDLAGRLEAVLEGGPCTVGLESTVLDLTGEKPVLLRPGGVTREELASILGEIQVPVPSRADSPSPSPGMKYDHYAPRAPMFLVEGEPTQVARRIQEMLRENQQKGRQVGLLVTAGNQYLFEAAAAVEVLGDRENPGEIAARLYQALRSLDRAGVDIILAEGFEEAGLGLALANRLRKASGGRVMRV